MIGEAFRKLITHADAVTRLVVINTGVFVFLNILHIIFLLFNVEHFLPAAEHWLGLKSNLAFLLYQPWTIITYAFVHADFFHLLWNMLMLFMAGKIFTEYLDGKKLVSLYFFGALAGAVLYLAAFNLLPKFSGMVNESFLVGASAAVLAILTATAFYVPSYRVNLMFLGPVKLAYIAGFFILTDIINFEKGNYGGHIAHIGGALMGVIFIRFYKKGTDITSPFSKLINSISGKLSRRNRGPLKVAFKKKMTDEEYNVNKIREQQQIDSILDKISKSGYESLSKREKEILFKMGNKK